MYFIKTPSWLKKVYGGYIWDIPVREKKIFLTFDDGPHPVATPFVLEQLKHYNARATFFCIGKNVQAEPALYQQLFEEGHRVGNHTHNHLNGWRTDTHIYLDNILQASNVINTDLFRPPYGRITRKQGYLLRQKHFRIIMWDVLSGDFDQSLAPEKCLANVVRKTTPGSIIVFHDSQKAFNNLQYVLPKALEQLSAAGFTFEAIA
ncbi:polysaccharide deacetylase family protein [Niabella soli]|uniref:polysaccharide deacetylase family protein n=1 Tax=Niabella soli TaxID=446683 RepID=UPI0002E630A5|nr:polysaccharide deacetylase family protein [Niabella soli]